MSKSKITRTYGPIHFEDLDPHRFEDLIRELIYEYKTWQSIEATGRSGSDDGFDIRAYEINNRIINSENNENEETIQLHPMEGNLWMIQGKREKQISPNKIKKILEDVDSNNPPYGYILAASANFSKKSYDTFRQELYKKGVMEFYIWGSAELEDMLHQPKNDRILFTFFGISLISKKREKTTEIRSIINVKNKLIKILETNKKLLVRDLNDETYPVENKSEQSEAPRAWNNYFVIDHHPLGLLIDNKVYYSYFDIKNKEWDYSDYFDLNHYEHILRDENLQIANKNKQDSIESFYDFLPRKVQGKLKLVGLLKYSDIVLVDDRGDNLYNMPHIYVSFKNGEIPFHKIFKVITINNQQIHLEPNFKRVSMFPSNFKKLENIKIHKNERISFNVASQRLFQSYEIDTIYCDDDRYEFLNPRDIIQVEGNGQNSEKIYIQITFKTYGLLNDYNNALNFRQINSIKSQLGRELIDSEKLYIYEFKRISIIQLDKLKE